MLNSQVEIGSTFTGFGISLKTRSKFRYYDLCEFRIFCCEIFCIAAAILHSFLSSGTCRYTKPSLNFSVAFFFIRDSNSQIQKGIPEIFFLKKRMNKLRYRIKNIVLYLIFKYRFLNLRPPRLFGPLRLLDFRKISHPYYQGPEEYLMLVARYKKYTIRK